MRTILVVDDDGPLCDMVEERLAREGTVVTAAHTAGEALRFCSERRFDVVLLDQRLPDGAVAGLCPSVLARNGDAKIVSIAAYPSFANAVAAIRAGAFGYLPKYTAS